MRVNCARRLWDGNAWGGTGSKKGRGPIEGH